MRSPTLAALRSSPATAALGEAGSGDAYLAAAMAVASQAPSLGRHYAEQGLQAYGRALSSALDPGLLTGESLALTLIGDHGGALAAQQRAVSLAPGNPELMLGLASDQEAVGDFEGMQQTADQTLTLSLQSADEGPRWQMIPAYALGGLFFLMGLSNILRPASRPAGRGWTHRLATVLGVGLGVLGLAVSTAPPMVFPVFHFPQPTGPYEIDTLTYHWVDAARPEVFTANPDDRRNLMVQVWYPARGGPSSPRAPYVQDAAALAPIARLLNLPAFTLGYFNYITTNAIPAAPVADGEPTYPVLIYSPGRGGYRQESTFQVEELVPHGYIVAAMDQPYANAGVVFPDGRLAAFDTRPDDPAAPPSGSG